MPKGSDSATVPSQEVPSSPAPKQLADAPLPRYTLGQAASSSPATAPATHSEAASEQPPRDAARIAAPARCIKGAPPCSVLGTKNVFYCFYVLGPAENCSFSCFFYDFGAKRRIMIFYHFFTISRREAPRKGFLPFLSARNAEKNFGPLFFGAPCRKRTLCIFYRFLCFHIFLFLVFIFIFRFFMILVKSAFFTALPVPYALGHVDVRGQI